jgi:hypothetical protein
VIGASGTQASSLCGEQASLPASTLGGVAMERQAGMPAGRTGWKPVFQQSACRAAGDGSAVQASEATFLI